MEITEFITELYANNGQSEYFGEEVTQYQHAAQSALLAEAEQADLEMQVAAFLHDIGHILPIQIEGDSQYGHTYHDQLAVIWLEKNGFSQRVQKAVGGHVKAKRYLCATNFLYYNKLSEASKQTLVLQGGMMNKTEIDALENEPYFKDIIKLRLWDDQAKNPDLKLPELDYFINKINKYLTNKA